MTVNMLGTSGMTKPMARGFCMIVWGSRFMRAIGIWISGMGLEDCSIIPGKFVTVGIGSVASRMGSGRCILKMGTSVTKANGNMTIGPKQGLVTIRMGAWSIPENGSIICLKVRGSYGMKLGILSTKEISWAGRWTLSGKAAKRAFRAISQLKKHPRIKISTKEVCL